MSYGIEGRSCFALGGKGRWGSEELVGGAEDREECVVVGLVFLGWQVRREDVTCSAVDDNAGGNLGRGFLVFHCGFIGDCTSKCGAE